MATAEVEVAGLGGDADFVKAMASWHGHWNVLPQIGGVLNVGLQSGFVMPWKRALYQRVKGEDNPGTTSLRAVNEHGADFND